MSLPSDIDAALSERGDGVCVEVWVVPGASRSEIGGIHDGALRVRVASPAESGKANRAVAKLLRKRLGASSVDLEWGHRGRRKRFFAHGLDIDDARAALTIATGEQT